MKRSFSRILLEKVIGYILFLIFLGIANIIGNYLGNNVYLSIIKFFNISILYLFNLMIFDLISETTWNLPNPIKLSAPVFSGIVGFLITNFILSMLEIVGGNIKFTLGLTNDSISIFVFFIVLIVGYVIIFSKKEPNENEKKIKTKKQTRKKKK